MSTRYPLALIVLVLAIGAWFATASASVQIVPAEVKASVEERRLDLEKMQGMLDGQTEANLIALRVKVRNLLEAGVLELAPYREAQEEANQELAVLGPVPAEGAPAESEEVAQQRTEIAARLTEVDSVIRQSDLNVALGQRLLDDIAKARRDLFYNNILQEDESPLSPDTLDAGQRGYFAALGRAVDWAKWEVSKRHGAKVLYRDLGILGGALALALVLLIPVRNWINRRIARYLVSNTPTGPRKVVAATARTLARVIPGVIGGLILYEALRWTGLLQTNSTDAANIPQIIWFLFLALLAVDGAATAVFSARSPDWQILPLRPVKARALRSLLIVATLVVGLDALAKVVGGVLSVPQETVLIQGAITSVLLAVLLIALTRPNLWTRSNGSTHAVESYLTKKAKMVPVVALITAVAIILAVALGYVALGYYISTRIFFLAGLCAAALCLRGVLHEAISYVVGKLTASITAPQADDAAAMAGTGAGASMDAADPVTGDQVQEENLIAFWLNLVLDIAIVATLVAPAMLILGADWIDVRDAVTDAFFGFEVGSVTISVADLLAGVGIFVAILWLTKVVQRTVENRLFPRTRLDPGVQHSFRTLIGYVGIAIAILAAVGAIGVNLSNLAIVAGALSVGIGFGLQSIVSNFVSGLILLFERPIKVGDMISVPSGDGFVRRISVRSTEIETFEKSHVIVPNSELVSGAVTNLTHGNRMARIIVPVGASYDEDPVRVMGVLKEIAADNPRVLTMPEPLIYFIGLGESSIDFELRCYVLDISTRIHVENELRIAVFSRFRAENIEIPFPQRVVHMKSDAVAEASEEAAAPTPPNPA